MNSTPRTNRFSRSRKILIATGLTLLLASCDSNVTSTSTGGGTDQPDEDTPKAPLKTVTLNAFGDFNCTPNWGNRDGALGLIAYTGQGTCVAKFPGESGKYKLTIKVQTEFDGSPFYKVSINGKGVTSGNYPYSTGQLYCACPLETWTTSCPDRIIELNGGVVDIEKGDTVEFFGAENFGCGEHGAYAKWHSMRFEPVPGQ